MANTAVSLEDAFFAYAKERCNLSPQVLTEHLKKAANYCHINQPLLGMTDIKAVRNVQQKIAEGKLIRFLFGKDAQAIRKATHLYYAFIKTYRKPHDELRAKPEQTADELLDEKQYINSQATGVNHIIDVPATIDAGLLGEKSPDAMTLLDYLEQHHIPYVDNRQKKGCLWIVGGCELKEIVNECSAKGVSFHFCANGSRAYANRFGATEHAPAWWTTDEFSLSSITVQRFSPVADLSADNSSHDPSTTILSEIDKLLCDEQFLPLRLSLKKENIRTMEELKVLKLWAFMNRNNLYSISMRQTVLDKVRQLLESAASESPELLYELHCGENVYSGDTLAKAFLHFCEDLAKKYPLFFRSLLDKKIGSVSDVMIYRSPKNENFIRMENPTCYVSADLAKDTVVAAAEWIMLRCVYEKIPVSIKEPDNCLMQSSHAEIPKGDLPDATLDEMHEVSSRTEHSISASRHDTSVNTNTFSLYLANVQKMANASCRSYASAIKTCEAYAKEHGYDSWQLYTNDKAVAQKTVYLLIRDAEFREFNNQQHNRFTAALTKFLAYIRDEAFDFYSIKQTEDASQQNLNSAVESDSEQLAKVEKIVLDADMNGITYDSLNNALRLTMVAIKALVQQCKRIVELKGKLYHENAFVDWDDGAKQMCIIMEKLMQKNNGYISAAQLYDYARAEMNMFLNDNDVNDERFVYEIAQHLFEKNSFEGNRYSFSGKAHISKVGNAIGSNFDVICKFSEEQGGVFQEEELIEYLTGIGIKTGNIRMQMHMGKEPMFFFYEPGTIISAKSMRIDDLWKESVMRALNNLLNDADDHIVLRQIQPVWFESLPALPGHKRWTPLLLQYILRFYGKELGAKTIMAMESQSMDTLHAMLVKADSPIENFGDAVISYLIDSDTEQRTFEAEALRQLLVKAGMIHGNELIWNMPKALAKDERFAWDAKGENVTVRV